MKKSKLIKLLSKIEGDPEVIMSSDAEGNSYEPVRVVDAVFYRKEGYTLELVDEEAMLDEGDSDEAVSFPAVCLWP